MRKKVEDQQLVRLKLCFLELKTTRQPKCLAQGYAAAALGFSVKLVAVETAPKQKFTSFPDPGSCPSRRTTISM